MTTTYNAPIARGFFSVLLQLRTAGLYWPSASSRQSTAIKETSFNRTNQKLYSIALRTPLLLNSKMVTMPQCQKARDLSQFVTKAAAIAASGGFGNIWLGELDMGEGPPCVVCTFLRPNRGTAPLILDVVFLCFQVAVKHLRPRGSTAADSRRLDVRLRREITVWERLRHDNVVPLLGTISGSNHLCTGMISPWMQKGNLNTFLEDDSLPYTTRSQLVCVVSNHVWNVADFASHSPVILPWA